MKIENLKAQHPEYTDIVKDLFSPFYITQKGDKRGMIDSKGKVILDCICNDITYQGGVVMTYSIGQKQGVMYTDGTIIPAVIDEFLITEPDEAFYVRIGDKKGYFAEDMHLTENEEEAYWGWNQGD